MLTKRIIPCLDVRRGKVTKGVRFQNNVELGDPVEMAAAYSEGGCDELVFYDITASAEHRPIDIQMVAAVARAIHIPFTVGGGITSLADMARVLTAGAEKISLNSLAVRNPALIAEGAKAFGSQCIVLGMDPVKMPGDPRFPSGYEITIRELADAIVSTVGVHGRLQFDTTKSDGSPQKLMNSSRLLAMGWRSKTTLQQGLELVYAWYVEHFAIRKAI